MLEGNFLSVNKNKVLNSKLINVCGICSKTQRKLSYINYWQAPG